MRSKPACLGGISLDFAGIPPSEMKIFDINTRRWASPAKQDKNFFNQRKQPLVGVL